MGPKQTTFKTFVSGSYFGEIEVLRNCQRLFTVRCEEDVDLLTIERDCFINILLKHPQVEIEVRDLSMKREEDMNNVLQEIEQLLDIDPNSNFWKKNNPDFASIMRSHRVKQREIRTKSLDLGKRSRPSN